MPLKAAASKINEKIPGPQCGLGKVLTTLNEDDLRFYNQMVADGAAGTYIAAVFREDGHRLSEYTVRRHIGGKCACP